MEARENYGMYGITASMEVVGVYTPKMDLHFGEFVRINRLRLGLKKKAFADLLAVNAKTITNIERRKDPAETDEVTRFKIAKAFGLEEQTFENWNTLSSLPEVDLSRAGFAVQVPLNILLEVQKRGAEVGFTRSQWAVGAIEAVLRILGWRPGDPLVQGLFIKPAESGGGRKKAAQTREEANNQDAK